MDDKLLIDWMQEVNKEFTATRQLMTDQHKELRGEVAANREEFIIFKTKVNTRTALISATAGFIAVVLSIILNIGNIKERAEAKNHTHDPTEIVDDSQ